MKFYLPEVEWIWNLVFWLMSLALAQYGILLLMRAHDWDTVSGLGYYPIQGKVELLCPVR